MGLSSWEILKLLGLIFLLFFVSRLDTHLKAKYEHNTGSPPARVAPR